VMFVALPAPAGSSAGPALTAASAGSLPTVRCDESGGVGVNSPQLANGSRLVLGVVAVPPAYIRQVVATRSQPWRFWSKWGLFIRAGSPAVVISVPKAWRTRAAITWGSGVATVSALRVASCPRTLGAWNGYPGGFFLRASSACVPLVVGVGQRSATVRFGIGRRCG